MPRCLGYGEIKVFGHVKEGICFNCWGSGGDLGGEIREATKTLYRLRQYWLYLARKSRRAHSGTSPEALAEIVTQGKKAALQVERLNR